MWSIVALLLVVVRSNAQNEFDCKIKIINESMLILFLFNQFSFFQSCDLGVFFFFFFSDVLQSPLATTFSLPSDCDSILFVSLCGGSGGHFGPNEWGDHAGGRGACLNVTGTNLLDFVKRSNFVVVGGGGSNVECGGGTQGGGGGGLSGLFSVLGSIATPILVAGGGGGASSSSQSSCDAVAAAITSRSIGGARNATSTCAMTNGNSNNLMFGVGGRESDSAASRGVSGSAHPNWSGGRLANALCVSSGGFGGGGSGGGTKSGFGSGGGGAGYPGGGFTPTNDVGGPAGRSFVDRAVVATPDDLRVNLTLNSPSTGMKQQGGNGALLIRCVRATTMSTTVTTTTSPPPTPISATVASTLTTSIDPTTTTTLTTITTMTMTTTGTGTMSTTSTSATSSTITTISSSTSSASVSATLNDRNDSSITLTLTPASESPSSSSTTVTSNNATVSLITNTDVAETDVTKNGLFIPLIVVGIVLCIVVMVAIAVACWCSTRRRSRSSSSHTDQLSDAVEQMYAAPEPSARSSIYAPSPVSFRSSNYGPMPIAASGMIDYTQLEVPHPDGDDVPSTTTYSELRGFE
jgi:hypothetical protein